jgi:hypothetical protein
MKKNQTRILAEVMEIKASIIELAIIAVLLALSINLISSSITLFVSPTVALVIGIFSAIISLGYFVLKLVRSRNKTYSFDGFFIYNKEDKNILTIPHYRYSEELSNYLKSAFSENEALRFLWEKESFENILKFEDGVLKLNHTHAYNLIIEATEYFLIKRLSSHLSAYFTRDKYPQNRLTTFVRQDIPDVLLSNSFLELFSKPVEVRPQFIGHTGEVGQKGYAYQIGDINSKSTPKLISAYGVNGAMYEYFELTLPFESKVKRLSQSSIEIDTNRFTMVLTVDFRGLTTVKSSEFYKYLLGIARNSKTTGYEISVNIDIRFKLITFFLASGWNYYYWVDSFIEEIKNYFEENAYLENIGWKNSLVILNFINSHQNKVAE